jgi:hypothetical protein
MSDMIKAKIAKETGMAMPQQVLKFKDSKGFLSDGLPFKDMGI